VFEGRSVTLYDHPLGEEGAHQTVAPLVFHISKGGA
jgi:hypothetical protein